MITQEKRYPRRAFCKTYGYVVEQKSVEDVWTVISVSKYSFEIKIGDTYASETNSFDTGYWKEIFDHLLPEEEALASTKEKNEQLTQRCPMDVCLCSEVVNSIDISIAIRRLQLLEDFYKEVCRIQNEESGNMRVGLALSRAIAKVPNNE